MNGQITLLNRLLMPYKYNNNSDNNNDNNNTRIRIGPCVCRCRSFRGAGGKPRYSPLYPI